MLFLVGPRTGEPSLNDHLLIVSSSLVEKGHRIVMF